MILGWKYPDFSQILLKPWLSTTLNISSWATPATIWTDNWFSVNWTPVNFISRALSENSYYKGSWTAWDYWMSWAFRYTAERDTSWGVWPADTTPNFTFRIAAPWTLSWWEIIWKIIQVALISWGRLASYWNGGYFWYKVKFKPWCLHSDWTITYAQTDSWRLLSWRLFKTAVQTVFVWTTSGVEAQEWDIFILDVSVQPFWWVGGTWTFTLYIYFWNDWSVDTFHWYPNSSSSSTSSLNVPVAGMWPNPFQVSIE